MTWLNRKHFVCQQSWSLWERGGAGFKAKFDNFDWGNSKRCKGVC
jgi:hypothetical protein